MSAAPLKLASDLSLPLDAVTETFGILAMRGAGKSNAGRVMAEEFHAAGAPFVVVDPVGSWFGLRAGRKAGEPGLAIPIFGGKFGDVPLERGGGHVIADLIADQRVSCVLDLSTFESEAAKKGFLLDFARRLYLRNEQPLHLFLEEADDYIPQRPMRDEAQLLRAWENIVRRGRARGLGITLITQRSASISKSVLTQVGTLIAMRTTSPHDRAAVQEWVRYHGVKEELLASLSSLENGEAWVWSPQFLGKTQRVRFRLSRTMDSGRTPKLGDARPTSTLADVDLGKIRRQMAETIERAKADDPGELRKEIRRLQGLVNAKGAPASPPAPPVVECVEVPVLAESLVFRLEDAAARLVTVQGEVGQVGRELIATLRDGHGRARQAEAAQRRQPTAEPAARRTPASPPARRQTAAPAASNAGLTGPEQRILDACAWMESIGIAEPQQTAVAFLAGYKIGGGAFNNPRGSLRSKGLVEYRTGERIALTDAGRPCANAPAADLTAAELQARVLERLPGPEQRILRPLLAAYPQGLTNPDLAAAAGYSDGGGAFNNPRGRLRTLGLIEYRPPGVVASPVLFLEA